MAFVEFEKVSKIYHTGAVEIPALRDATFQVEKGEICVIVGASGAGKTTLLNILGGMDTLTGGTVKLDGRDISRYDRRQLTEYRRRDVGFVFQFYNLVQNLTARENVELAAEICRDPLDADTVLDEVEYRQRDSVHFYFKPLDKRTRNSIALCALKEGLQVWDRDIDRFLTSDFVPLYNPVEEYLCDLPRWDGTDRIRALARLVPCGNPHWEELFYRWFLGMVAHWRGMDRQHGNSTSPLLVGSQGFRKSTYCRILLPPELRFGYADSLDFSSKQEAERALGRFFLINLDEFDQITVNQQGFLKHLLQKPTANLRKPYGTSVRELRRYASFIGTSNQKDLLTDPTGSRRFICIEVTDPIDTNVTIDYRQLYAQAMHLLYKNERYWLNDEDEAVLRQSNSEFEQISPLEHLFHCNFSSATNEKEGEWMTAMDIFNYLQENTRDKLSINKINWFGRILRKLNIPKKTSTRGTLYHVTKLK